MRNPEAKPTTPRPRLLLSVFAMGGGFATFVAICWLLFGRLVAQKIATELVQPVGFLTYLLSTLVLHAARQREYGWVTYTGIPLVFLILAGNGFVANWQLGKLELAYRTIAPLEGEKLDVLVVLGGSTSDAPQRTSAAQCEW